MPKVPIRALKLDSRVPSTFFSLTAHDHTAIGFLAGHFVNHDYCVAGRHSRFHREGTAVGADHKRASFLDANLIVGVLADDLDGNINSQTRTPPLRPRITVGWRSLDGLRLASTVEHNFRVERVMSLR